MWECVAEGDEESNGKGKERNPREIQNWHGPYRLKGGGKLCFQKTRSWYQDVACDTFPPSHPPPPPSSSFKTSGGKNNNVKRQEERSERALKMVTAMEGIKYDDISILLSKLWVRRDLTLGIWNNTGCNKTNLNAVFNLVFHNTRTRWCEIKMCSQHRNMTSQASS